MSFRELISAQLALFYLGENDEGPPPRMKAVTRGGRPSCQLRAVVVCGGQEREVGAGLLNSRQASLLPPTADSEAMSSAATVETFSIMSTHGSALKCSARGFGQRRVQKPDVKY